MLPRAAALIGTNHVDAHAASVVVDGVGGTTSVETPSHTNSLKLPCRKGLRTFVTTIHLQMANRRRMKIARAMLADISMHVLLKRTPHSDG